MQNYSKIGGVLSIVAGGIGIFWVLMIITFAGLLAYVPASDFNGARPDEVFVVFIVVWVVVGLFTLAVGALAIVGGIYALRKKYWGLALAGSIAAVLSFFPCGIPAVIFVALGKPEFIEKGPSGGGGS